MPPPFRESDPAPAAPPSSTAQEAPHHPILAISATFTSEALEPTLAFWLAELKLDYQVRFAPYNQVFQQLLDPASLLGGNRNGINVVLVRLEDWARFRNAVSLPELEVEVRNLESALRSAASTARSPMLVCLCPASRGFMSDTDRVRFVARSEESLRSALRDAGAVHLVSAAEIDRLYPVSGYDDPHADELGHVPYTPEFFAALGTMIARKLHARTNRYKLIALDCDETLWDGVCGEDGPSGVRLGAGHQALQAFMLQQRESGLLLALCSKNNPEDVYETFRAHPEMPLHLKHFAATRLNWEPKSANLRSLADELGLGTDSFILVDNSATECAEVQAGSPGVLTLALPAATAEFASFLRHIWAFDRWSLTEADRQRAGFYAQEAERSKAQRQSSSLSEFLASLNLEIRFTPLLPEHLARVAQLTERTNQMNFTSIRRSEVEIQSLLDRGAVECLTVDVSDRFGSYGLAGVILFRVSGQALTVDSFLLSCRALGRGVEHRMLARLGEIARERGLAEVEVLFIPLQRNRPAGALLSSIGAQFEQPNESGSIFRFPAAYLEAVRYTADERAAAASGEWRVPVAPQASSRAVDYFRIARELREPAQILEAVRQRSRRRVTLGSSGRPRTDLEKQVAEMWAQLLGLPAVGVHDNFFDLGGHSLLAVQLLSLIRQTFGVELSLKVVYSSDFTVAELAKAIELREIEGAGSEQYAAILKELEGLTEDEVRRLLAEEQNGAGGSQ
jgi:FkbH-like protein